MQPSVSLKNVSITLGGASALKDVSVDIPSGKIVGLLGPSGAGKTTLMRVIVGRQRIQYGSAEVLGKPAGAAALRGRIGYMPQSAAIHPDLTVKENIGYFASMLGLGKKEAAEVIAEVDLRKQVSQLVSTLSGGQKSRVSLAVALLGCPNLLVLDEPTVGVDPVLRLKLWKIFRNTAAKGATICVSSHVMDEASRCDDLLLIRRGRLLAHGSPDELLLRTGTATIEDSFLALVGNRQ